MLFRESKFERPPETRQGKEGEKKKIEEEIPEKKISKKGIEETEKAELERTRRELKEIMGEVPKEKKEKPEKRIVKRLKKLTAKIEQAIIERIKINPDVPAEEKDFDNLNSRLISEAEILAKRYKIEDEIDERGNIIKEGYEKILEIIGYNYDEKKRYEGIRKGDLINYERNALFRMWNLPADKNDIERFENKINREAEKLAESKRFKKYGISKEKILEAIEFGETEEAIKSPKGITREDLLSWEHYINEINNLTIDKNGEIKTSGVRFLESPKSKWAKKAFAIGVPTLLLFSLYANAPKPGKEKPVSLQELEKNPDLMDKVYKEAIFRLIAPEGSANIPLITEGDFPFVSIDLKYSGDIPYLGVYPPPGAEAKYFEEMERLGLYISEKNPNIPLSFYLEHQEEIDKILSKDLKVRPNETQKINGLIEIKEITDSMNQTRVLSWENFSIGNDTPENIEKISDFKELLIKYNTETFPSPVTPLFDSQDQNFRKAIDQLFQKEGYWDMKLKEIAKEDPKELIKIIAEIIHKNVKYDEERYEATKRGALVLRRPLPEILEKGGLCGEISSVVSATADYMQSKEILPKNLLVGVETSEFMEHGINSILTIDSSGKLVSTHIDVTWFSPEDIEKAPQYYDLSAVDYYHKLGLSKEQIKEIMTARFSEYAKLTKDISTYDPWLHKREREIIWNQKEKPSEK